MLQPTADLANSFLMQLKSLQATVKRQTDVSVGMQTDETRVRDWNVVNSNHVNTMKEVSRGLLSKNAALRLSMYEDFEQHLLANEPARMPLDR